MAVISRLMAAALAAAPALSWAAVAADSAQRLFTTEKGAIPYRIPAIATCKDGTMVAVADYRYCGGDIGGGAVDLHYRLSRDNGRTWGVEMKLADGHGDEADTGWSYALGDCAIVADRTSPEVLVICVGGKSPYWSSTRENPNRTARFRSHDNGKTWDKGEEITEQIYGLLDQRAEGPIKGLFMGSGKIHQSRYVRTGKYYRLYAALCTRSGNFVVYSDDFGQNWKLLGLPNTSPCPDGDEPKCEELPDGSVVLSSRANGRLFNVFTYTDAAAGKGWWDKRAAAGAFAGIQNACNGEILILPAKRKADGKKTYVALQSVPFGPGRNNVGFYYREIPAHHIGAAELAGGWERGMQVSSQESAYSTMAVQPDGKIAFLWEEGPTWYNIDYRALSLEEATLGKYKAAK